MVGRPQHRVQVAARKSAVNVPGGLEVLGSIPFRFENSSRDAMDLKYGDVGALFEEYRRCARFLRKCESVMQTMTEAEKLEAAQNLEATQKA